MSDILKDLTEANDYQLRQIIETAQNLLHKRATDRFDYDIR